MLTNRFTNVKNAAVVLLLLMSALFLTASSAHAAEGGYTNYVPGLYGDFGVAVAPEPGFYLRTDLYYYTADKSKGRWDIVEAACACSLAERIKRWPNR